MRVGVVSHDRVAVFQHSVGENSVQVERHHERNLLAENAPRFLEQEPFRIVFIFGLHRSVEREVGGIHRSRPARIGQAAEELIAKSFEAVGRKYPSRSIGTRPQRGDEFDAAVRIEDAQRPANLFAYSAMMVEQAGSTHDAKVLEAARHRIERRDFLLALSNDDAGHTHLLSLRSESSHRFGDFTWTVV